MSQNAAAIDLSTDVIRIAGYKPTIQCRGLTGSLYNPGSNVCVFGINVGTALQGRGIGYIQTSNVNLVAGDYYEVSLDLLTDSGAEYNIPAVWNLRTTPNYDIVDFEQVSNTNNLGTSSTSEFIVTSYRIILQGLATNSAFPIELGDGSASYLIYLGGDSWSTANQVRVNRVNQYRLRAPASNSDVVAAIEQLSQQEQQQQQQEQQSIDNIENQSTSDIPTGDNQSATNLIGNITSIFNQIKDAPVRNNCNIPANWGHLNLGNVNLCTGKENMPFIVNFGAAVFQLVFVVGTGLILVRQVLALYDWSRK